MSLKFRDELIIGGSGEWDYKPFRFNVRKINIGKAEPSWKDVILSGVSPLTLVNAKEDGLNYLKLFGGTKQRNLPSGYTQVEYLQSDGACYIDLLRVPNNDDIIEQKFQILSTSSGTFSWYGSMPSSSQLAPRIGMGVFGSGTIRKFFLGINSTTEVSSANTDINTIRFQATGEGEITYTYNGETFTATSLSINTFSPSVTLTSYLFARHGVDGVQTYDGRGTRIFYHKEYLANGTLALDVVPCRRDSDNVLGMYDTVTGNFLPNQGTGTFTAGADVTPSPDAPIDIVCNNGTIKVSPNLFNKDLVPNVNEYINKGNGSATIPSNGTFRHSDYITIKENTQYYVGIINALATSAGLAFYNDTKNYLSGISLTQLGNDNNIITSPANTKYIRFSFRIDEGYNTNWQNTVYFVEGNQPLAEFIPYGKAVTDGTVETVEINTTGDTATAEMLLKIGDYKDEQSILDGGVIRNVGIKVLDGSENWKAHATLKGWFQLPEPLVYGGIAPALCTHYPYKSNQVNEGVFFSTGKNDPQTNRIIIADDVNFPSTDMLEEFKQYLASQYANGTPVIVVYPLATPTTESVTGQPLTVQQGTNIVTITQASINNLTLEVSYKAAAQVTITEVQNSQLSNNVEVTIND